MEKATREEGGGLRTGRGFVLGSLSFGHGISHLFSQGFPLLLTEISAAFGLSTFQKASIFAVRQVGSGAVNLGAGPLVDMFKSHWGLILTGCMLFHAITFALAGFTPNYPVLLFIALFITIPGSLWHLPAAAAISQRFPDRRGFAVTLHGFGANIGNVIGPLLTGALLGVFAWRPTFFIYALPYLATTFFVWWSLKGLGKEAEGEDEERKALGGQYRDSARLLRNPVVMGLIGAAMLRGIGLSTVNNWTPFYLKEPIEDGGLAMGSLEAGFFLSLLTGVGILSTPVLGALSDKYGRKQVLVPGFIAAAVLSFLVVGAGDSRLFLGLVLAGMGVFTFALHQIIQATVLDVVGRGTEAKALGLLFGLSGIIGVATPFIASVIIDHAGGFGSIYYYAGILTACTVLVVIVIPIRPLDSLPPARP